MQYLQKNEYIALQQLLGYLRYMGYEYRNRGIKYQANKYNIDEDRLSQIYNEYIQEKKKGKSNNKGIKYKYYIGAKFNENEAQGLAFAGLKVIKASNFKNANSRCDKIDDFNTRKYDYGGAYAPMFHSIVINKEFETEDEANKIVQQIRSKISQTKDGYEIRKMIEEGKL